MVDLIRLQSIAGPSAVWQQESMAEHTTFHIGGPADFFVEISDSSVLRQIIQCCVEETTPYFILGNGSNLLVSDDGYRGVMLSTKGLDQITIEDSPQEGECFCMTAGSGVLLSKLAAQAASAGLTGLEFASGIPGSVGGAVVMNAGAYGGEIANVLQKATVMKTNGTIEELSAEELELSYRHSILQREPWIVLEAVFALQKGDAAQIRATMQDYNQRRREKQPLEYGSAGSTFKRPEGYFAGKLIQDAGLKGYRVGDVMVSEKHAGFVVNVGKGTCREARAVIEHVQQTVYDRFQVRLEPEVKLL